MTVLAVVVIVVVLELLLVLTVRSLRREFQWLITEADELPALDPVALQKFLDSSFDSRLGWVRRPNTTGREKGKKGEITFRIESNGARASAEDPEVQLVAAFGDSYVFCRQVEDNETWEESLSRSTGVGVLNYGVGNYGADQGLLRYETTELPSSVRVAILGFVPETICRVQSYWKHYLEFGNTFAFKPRFELSSGELVLHPSAMESAEDFSLLPQKLQRIQKLDGFYRRKFRSFQFRLPYLASFSRHPLRHGRLIAALLTRRLADALGYRSSSVDDGPFALIMQRNIADAHRMYEEPAAVELLRAVLLRFQSRAAERGHQPLILVIPQLIDLTISRDSIKPYQSFFRDLSKSVPVLDVTSALQRFSPDELYVDDRYGGHLSPHGNEIVAGEVAAWLQQYLESAQGNKLVK